MTSISKLFIPQGSCLKQWKEKNCSPIPQLYLKTSWWINCWCLVSLPKQMQSNPGEILFEGQKLWKDIKKKVQRAKKGNKSWSKELTMRQSVVLLLLWGALEAALLSVLLTQRCLDTWGLYYNLGFNRCAFYVAGSPEFRCRCPHRWGRKAGHKTCLWNFGRINADMTASEQRSHRLTVSA